jgi:hypothetical protein
MRTEAIWEQLVGKGIEHLILRQRERIEANGLAAGVLEDIPYRINYQIVCDQDWKVQSVRVEDLLNDKVLVLIKSRNDGWMDEQNHRFEELNGCMDVDIRITPFTNTLPIKKLKLGLNESKEISVVYFRVPDLGISKFKQRYTFLARAEDHEVYKYESLDSDFTSDITVGMDGLVIDYPGIFKLAWKQTDKDLF